MAFKVILAFALVFILAEAQRPFYAGLRPIGIPAVESDSLLNRFGEDEDLPIIAHGDRNLINRLNQLPEDKQPFWYLNWRAYKNQKPQTVSQRPNIFID